MINQATSSHPRWEKFAHALLTTTCLSVAASGAASAGIIVEGTSPAPANFPTTPPGFLLPVGTTVVQGIITSPGDTSDWFEFQGLAPATSFSILGTTNPLSQESGAEFGVFNTSLSLLGANSMEGSGGTVAGTVPGDGDLLVEVVTGGPGSVNYQIALTAQEGVQTPEPDTFVGTGLALAALAWQRKRAART